MGQHPRVSDTKRPAAGSIRIALARLQRGVDMSSWMKPLMAALALTAAGAVLVEGGVAGSQTAGDYERVVRIVRGGPSDGCSADNCVTGVMEPVTTQFVTVGDPVRVVASVSLQYRTSVHDPAEVSLLWRAAGTMHFNEAAPGPSPLAPSHSRTTTSVIWLVSGLSAGTDYEFAVSVRGRPPKGGPEVPGDDEESRHRA